MTKFASEASEKMKNLEPITSDVDAVVAQLRDFKVFILSCNCVHADTHRHTWIQNKWRGKMRPTSFMQIAESVR